MKLADMREHAPTTVRAGVERQLGASGLTELASIALPADQDQHFRVYVATDLGFYFGVYIMTRSGTLDGELTPWPEVSGARMVLAGFGGEFSTVLYRSAAPEISVSASGASTEEFRALGDLAKVAMRNARGWMAATREAAPPVD